MSSKESRERLAAYRDARRHPIFSVLESAAAGYVPTDRELAALELDAETRQRVFDHAKIAAGLRAEGEHEDAREHARDAALRVIGRLPDQLRRSDYLAVPEPETNDPAELAAQVRRT